MKFYLSIKKSFKKTNLPLFSSHGGHLIFCSDYWISILSNKYGGKIRNFDIIAVQGTWNMRLVKEMQNAWHL